MPKLWQSKAAGRRQQYEGMQLFALLCAAAVLVNFANSRTAHTSVKPNAEAFCLLCCGAESVLFGLRKEWLEPNGSMPDGSVLNLGCCVCVCKARVYTYKIYMRVKRYKFIPPSHCALACTPQPNGTALKVIIFVAWRQLSARTCKFRELKIINLCDH